MYRRVAGACCLYRQGTSDDGAAGSSETSIHFHKSIKSRSPNMEPHLFLGHSDDNASNNQNFFMHCEARPLNIRHKVITSLTLFTIDITVILRHSTNRYLTWRGSH